MHVHQHARPHIETHTRKQGHNAIAGAAYRLGLRLYDEKADAWYDFRKRKLGEEVVKALTIAPPGAPSWATNPQALWAKVEGAEKRSDSQLARDFRIPIPFGLSDSDACALAEDMAQFICETLHTPVSLGLHRDADRDALGVLKPKDQQGFHAHLYFPTRPLIDEDGSGGDSGTSDTGFGTKLTQLSNKNQSGVFVEMLNCRWSELCNDYARQLGSQARYEYKSYKRLGLNITPQPTLGRSATAMERKGIYSNRGDALREALAIAHVHRQAQAEALSAQHQKALKDVQREGRLSGGKSSRQDLAEHARSNHSATTTRTTVAVKKAISAHSREAFTAPVLFAKRGSLAWRIRQGAKAPETREEAEELDRALVLLEALDKAFAVYHALMLEVEEALAYAQRIRASQLASEHQVSQSRARRKDAHTRLSTWENENRFRLKFYGAVGGKAHPTHAELKSQVALHNRHVQELKQTIEAQGDELKQAEVRVAELEAQKVEAIADVRQPLVALDDAQSPWLPQALKMLPDADQALVRQELPTLFSVEEAVADVEVQGLVMPVEGQPVYAPKPSGL